MKCICILIHRVYNLAIEIFNEEQFNFIGKRIKMCGISACIKKTHSISTRGLFENNLKIIHRGPDDFGYEFFKERTIEGQNKTRKYERIKNYQHYNNNALAITHRRLSVIDLSSAAHQPMSFADERYWIIYNGEVYNYKELREELEALGYQFKSHTDTEVVLASYVQWGKECLHRFNGMWVFIIFDSETGTVFASRDRFGVKPLYYWYSPEGFLAFASEIKQFTALPGWSALLNRQRAYDFLTFGLIDHTHETLFADVYQLRGGEAIEFPVSDVPQPLPVYRWYNLDITKFQGTYDDVVLKFRDILSDAVRLRLRSDVPIGSCLSGGLDSSSIVCLANDILKESGDQSVQKTFSAFSHERRVDESGFVSEVVACRNIESLSIYPDMDDLFRELDGIIWHQDEPFDSTSIFAQWNVFRLASQHQVKVMLDGQGADELLGGYHYFFGIHFAGLLSKLKFFTLFKEIIAARKLHSYRVRSNLGHIVYFTLPGSLRGILDMILPQHGEAKDWFNLGSLTKNPEKSPFIEIKCNDPFTDECYSRLLTTNLPALLHWEDRNSMAFSIESRVPFLDYRLVEFSMSLPTECKINEGITKKVLRDSMTGILPEKIVTRRDKLGFATPEEEWIRKNPDVWRKAVQEAIIDSQGIIKSEALNRFNEVLIGKRPFTQHIWRAICFGAWMKKFHVQLDPAKDSTK